MCDAANIILPVSVSMADTDSAGLILICSADTDPYCTTLRTSPIVSSSELGRNVRQ